MAAPLQPGEGFAQVQYQMALPQQQFQTFDPEQVSLVEANLRDDVFGDGSCIHVFQSNNVAYLTMLQNAMSNGNPLLMFRLGFGPATGMYWLPWQQHIVTRHYAKFQGIGDTAGHLLVVHSSNSLVRIRRTQRVLSRKGLISDMVSAIAQANGLKAVVEPTDGKYLLMQAFTDDTTFLLKRLLPRAINQQGRGGYFCFILDNVLHFHTPDYQASVKKMDFYGSYGSSLEANDYSEDSALWDAGIAGARVVAADPYTGDSKEFLSDPAKAVKLAHSIYQFDNVDNGQRNQAYHLGQNPVSELNALAQFRYQHARLQTFRSVMVLQKTINIRHGDLLGLAVTQEGNRTSEYSGYYYVTSAAHTVKKSLVTSVYTLNRGETELKQTGLATQNSQDQLVSQNNAPGVTPNIISLQSSALTKGSGNTTSATTLLAVADAQTGATD